MKRSEREKLEHRVIPVGNVRVERNPETKIREPETMDSTLQRMTIVLTGARRDFTGILGHYPVQKGVIKLAGVPKDVLAWARHIEMNYQGFPMGDPRIGEHEQRIADSFTGEGHEGRVQAGRPVADGQADAPGGAGAGLPKADQSADVGSGAGGGTAGSTDAGTSGGDGHQAKLTAPANPKMVAAIAKLDDKNDKHWTRAGEPMISAVEKFYGAAVTRAMIVAASSRTREIGE